MYPVFVLFSSPHACPEAPGSAAAQAALHLALTAAPDVEHHEQRAVRSGITAVAFVLAADGLSAEVLLRGHLEELPQAVPELAGWSLDRCELDTILHMPWL
jgi:hypothetical protein